MESNVPSLREISDSQVLLNWFLQSTPEEVVEAWKLQDGGRRNDITNLCEDVRVWVRRQMLETTTGMVTDAEVQLSPLTVYVISEAIVRAKRREEVVKKLGDYRLTAGDFKLSEIKPYVVNSMSVLNKIYLIYSFQYAAIYLQVGRIFKNGNIKLNQDVLDTLILHNASLSRLARWYELIMITASADELDEQETISDVDLKNRKDPLAASLPDDALVDNLKKSILATLTEAKVFPRALITLLQKQEDVSVLFVFINAIITAATHLDSLSEIQIRERVAHLAQVQDLIKLNNDWLMLWSNTASSEKIR